MSALQGLNSDVHSTTTPVGSVFSVACKPNHHLQGLGKGRQGGHRGEKLPLG